MEVLLHPRMPQLIMMGSGALLIIVGLVLTIVQFRRGQAEDRHMERGLHVGGDGVRVKTTYVGLLIVAIGALLEALAAYLWRGVG